VTEDAAGRPALPQEYAAYREAIGRPGFTVEGAGPVVAQRFRLLADLR
jgi:hypothetical protein